MKGSCTITMKGRVRAAFAFLLLMTMLIALHAQAAEIGEMPAAQTTTVSETWAESQTEELSPENITEQSEISGIETDETDEAAVIGDTEEITVSEEAPVVEEDESTDGSEATEENDFTEAIEATEVIRIAESAKDAMVISEEDALPNSCYATDSQGRKYSLYQAPEDSTLYLFLPATEELDTITLNYAGTIKETASGSIDAEAKTITGAFAETDSTILTDSDGLSYEIEVVQSSLPAFYITLKDGVSLSDIHADKDAKFKKNTVEVLDPSGTYSMKVENAVEIKGRGNSTWRLYDKKGYQIKFSDPTSVLGMEAAGKWVLLANAGDDSLMRTQLVYRMAKEMDMGFVPTFRYTDLWIDGEYRGTYIIGDKVEIGPTRLVFEDETGALFEHDEAFYQEEDYWFYSDILQRHFVLKEISDETDESISAAMADFKTTLDEFVSYLYSTPSQAVTLEALGNWIDVDSFVKYYLVNEYSLNREAFATSFYWYKDGPNDIIHLGPLWDFDTCMGNDGQPSTASYGENHVLFQYLLSAPAFYNRTQELLETYRSTLESMTADVSTLKRVIGSSADMNYLRWDTLGQPNPKQGSSPFAETYELAVDTLKGWLRSRESDFKIVKRGSVTSVVSDDCKKMDVNFWDGNDYNSVRFGVWSLKNGQDDLLWYSGTQNGEGEWICSVDLTKHATDGMYRIVARPNGGTNSMGSGYNYVSFVAESDYNIIVTVRDDCTAMSIRMTDKGLCSAVSFAVWSEEGGQNDLKWYNGTRGQEDDWLCEVDLARHNSAGRYYVHAYGTVDGNRSMVSSATAQVAKAVSGPTATAQVSSDGKRIELKLVNSGDYERVWAPVWTVQGGQDDIFWYELQKTGDGQWEGEASLLNHGTAGTYLIHFYGGSERPEDFLTDQELFVSSVPLRCLSAAVDENCDTMVISVEGAALWKQLWIPVWSDADGQDDIQWYRPVSKGNGAYEYAVDLRKHNSAGTYHIHLYGGDSDRPETLIDYMTVNVASLPKGKPVITVDVTEASIELTLQNCADQENIWIPVWSDEGGQDDIRWYCPEKQNDGTWYATVNLTEHGSTGLYHIHVYAGGDAPAELLTYTDVTVAQIVRQPILKTSVSEETNTIMIWLQNAEEAENVWFPVWSSEDMSDLTWYQPSKLDDGSWFCSVPLVSGIGVYHVHAYSGTEAPEQLIAYKDILR